MVTIGTDAIVIATAALVWYYEYRENCLIGSRKSALSRKFVQGIRVWFYVVWLFLLLMDMTPVPFKVLNSVMAIICVFVIILHAKIFFSRTIPEFKDHTSAYDHYVSWAEWFGFEESKEDKKKRKKKEKERRKKKKEKSRRRAAKKHKYPNREYSSDSSYSSDESDYSSDDNSSV